MMGVGWDLLAGRETMVTVGADDGFDTTASVAPVLLPRFRAGFTLERPASRREPSLAYGGRTDGHQRLYPLYRVVACTT